MKGINLPHQEQGMLGMNLVSLEAPKSSDIMQLKCRVGSGRKL
jgi:hypothetical protein